VSEIVRAPLDAAGTCGYDVLLGACGAKGDLEGARYLMQDLAKHGVWRHT
jgi:pentatricopeptide repeat protein